MPVKTHQIVLEQIRTKFCPGTFKYLYSVETLILIWKFASTVLILDMKYQYSVSPITKGQLLLWTANIYQYFGCRVFSIIDAGAGWLAQNTMNRQTPTILTILFSFSSKYFLLLLLLLGDAAEEKFCNKLVKNSSLFCLTVLRPQVKTFVYFKLQF